MIRSAPKKVDANHAAIRDGLRKNGYSVADTHEVGSGFPDLVVGQHSQTFLIEIKRPRNKKGEPAMLTETERLFHRSWKGGTILVVTSMADAMQQLPPPVGCHCRACDHHFHDHVDGPRPCRWCGCKNFVSREPPRSSLSEEPRIAAPSARGKTGGTT